MQQRGRLKGVEQQQDQQQERPVRGVQHGSGSPLSRSASFGMPTAKDLHFSLDDVNKLLASS
jgi:hypothetical protein